AAPPGADRAAEGGIVAGPAADDNSDLAGAGRASADQAAGHLLHVLGECAGESRQRLAGKVGRVVGDLGHRHLLDQGLFGILWGGWWAGTASFRRAGGTVLSICHAVTPNSSSPVR